jgi:hypothetical protein
VADRGAPGPPQHITLARHDPGRVCLIAMPAILGVGRPEPAAEQGSGVREDRGEGAAAHPGRGAGLGEGGGGQTAAKSTTAELGTCRENGDDGIDSQRLRSIPPMGVDMETRWTFSAHRGSTGGRGMATPGDGHGGRARHLRACSREREREGANQRDRGEREGGGAWVLIPSPRTSAVARIPAGDRRWRLGHRGAPLC